MGAMWMVPFHCSQGCRFLIWCMTGQAANLRSNPIPIHWVDDTPANTPSAPTHATLEQAAAAWHWRSPVIGLGIGGMPQHVRSTTKGTATLDLQNVCTPYTPLITTDDSMAAVASYHRPPPRSLAPWGLGALCLVVIWPVRAVVGCCQFWSACACLGGWTASNDRCPYQ